LIVQAFRTNGYRVDSDRCQTHGSEMSCMVAAAREDKTVLVALRGAGVSNVNIVR
jgi:hypothetical protein